MNNVCVSAAIYGLDGVLWAASTSWEGLSDYDHPLENEDGTTSQIKVSEFQCAIGASNGKRMPSAAGIRMNKTKFMLVRHDEESKVCYCSR